MILSDDLIVKALRDADLGDVADLLEERLAEDAPPAGEDAPKEKAATSIGARMARAAGA